MGFTCVDCWIGLFAPTKTPPAAIDELRAAVMNVMQTIDIRKRVESSGGRTFAMTAKETERFVKGETKEIVDF
jgi:tripartite-type tricarboxylate transporter receptor subunit TctC